jgi:5,10-methylenetetrahydromethanopterin reductase
MECWLHAFPVPHRTAARAAEAEAQGYDGMLLADSPMLVADPYLELLLAARQTERLRLGPGVTNPVNRHPVVTAASIATLQIESGGRAVLVMGRGDSAVLQLGLRPATTAALDDALTVLQNCLRGRSRAVSDGLLTRMGWIDRHAMPEIPVSVAATGPATIALGARHGGRVDLTVGADPERIAWAVGEARRACPDPDTLSLGAFVNVAVHPDRAVARDLVRGSAAIFAHFVSEGPLDGLPERDRTVVAGLGAAYAEAHHGQRAAAHATALPDDFLDRFAVVGTPADCLRRLRELGELGLDRIVVVPGSRDADPQLLAASDRRFAEEVLPGLRS